MNIQGPPYPDVNHQVSGGDGIVKAYLAGNLSYSFMHKCNRNSFFISNFEDLI